MAQSKLWNPETLCITIAANIAETAILKIQACFPDSVVGFVADPMEADVRFVKYYIDTIKLQMQSVSKGTTQDNLSLEKLLGFDFSVPPLHIQRQIADILSAYDELIEVNAQQIKILEEQAQLIYREWFVNFRFPGYEQVEMVESAIGLIPEGWEVRRATDSVWFNPKLKVSKESKKPFITMGNLTNDSMLIDVVEHRVGNSGSKFQNGDTVFARITPCLENGKTGFVQFLSSEKAVAVGSTEFIVLRSKTLCPEYVYLMARSDAFRDNAIKSMSGATGRQRVKESCFEQFLLAQPTPEFLARFSEIVNPLFQSVQVLATENQNLRSTRDRLLPKLISGEIDLEALEVEEIDTAIAT